MGNVCNYQVFKKITQAIAPAKTLKIQMPLLLSQKPLTQKTHLTLKLPIQPLVKASKPKPFLSLLLSLILPITSTYAAQPSPNQIVDREKSPSLSLDKTNNGVDLIHLSTPDKNLQSHNVFKHFNVDKKGAILNNSNALINSKLGGMIPPNPNYAPNAPLAKEILLEVSGNTKSSLLGYLEIAGGKADLILSNPNGIYLNGAGFINTHNLLLNTTANSPHPLYDSKIEIDGLGADLSTLNKAEFITQVAHLNAPLYGGKEVVFNIEGFKDSNPSFGFDARILGSLYAGKITIIANKEGVGVKSEGGLYANADSLSINAKGEIIIKEMLAKENIALESLDKITLTTKAQAQKLSIKSPTLESTAKLHFKDFATLTNAFKNTGELRVSNLNMQSNNFNNGGDIKGHTFSLNTQALENTGGIVVQDLVLNTQSLNNQGNIRANTFKAQLKDYNFKDGEILVGDSLSLEANNLTLSKAFNTPSNVFINLKGDFHNTKNFSANSLHLQANKVSNTSLIALREDSTLESKTFSNAKNARLLSLGDLQLKNQSLHNQGEILANSLNIHTHRLDNLSASIQSLQDFNLSTNTLNNQGSILQSSYTTRWYYPQDNLKKAPAIASKELFLKTLDKDFQNLYRHFSKPQGQWISSPYVKNIEIPNSNLKTHKASLKAGGNFTIKAKEILNQEAEIIAKKSLNITTQSLKNTRSSIPLNLKVIYGRDYEVVEHRTTTLHGDLKPETIKQEALKEGKVSNERLGWTRRGIRRYAWAYNYTLTKTLAPEYKSNYTTSLFSNTPTLILAGGNATIQAQNILNQSFLGFRGNTTLNTHTLNNAKDATLFNNATLSLQAHSFKNEGEIRGENLNATLNTLENKAGKITFNQNASLKLQTLKNQGITNKTYSQKWVNADKSALILEDIPEKDLIEPRASLNAQRLSHDKGTWDNSPPEYIAGSELITSNAPSFKASLEVKGNLNIQAKEILNQEADILVGKNLQITTNVLNNAKTPQYAKVDFTLNHPFRYVEREKWYKPKDWHNGVASTQGSTNQLFYSASQTSILVGGKANIKARKIGNGEILENRKNTQFSKSTPLIALNPLLNFLIPAPNNALFSKGRKATPTPATYSLNLSALNNSLFTLNTNKDSPLLTLNPTIAEFYNDTNVTANVNNVGIKTSSEALASTTLKAPIESNPLYTDTSMLLSSDYFLNKLGFNPKRRFLGDNAFEKILITQSILNQSPKQYLGNINFNSLKQSLLENALLEQSRLGLIAGIPLTQEQREALDKDILWYEYQSIQTPDGEIQEVLVPKLYLAKDSFNTSNALTTASSIEVQGDLTLQANTLNNQGTIKAYNLFASLQGFIQESNFNEAKIEAKDNLFLNTQSFKNLGGSLKAGENLNISTQDFLNQSKFLKGNLYKDNADTFYQNTFLKDRASMEGRNIFIKAQDFSSRASLFKAKDSLFIAAEDISLLGDNSSRSIQRGAGDNSFLSVVSNHSGNSLEAKDMVIFSQGDIKSIGSNFSAQGDLILESKNLYLLPGRNIESLEIKTKHKGAFKSTQEISFYEKSTYSKNTLEGANIALRAKEDLILYGVDLKATPSITLEGANILQAGVKDTIKSYHSKSSSTFFGLSKREFKETSLREQAQYALVNSDANLSYKALSSLVLEGVRLNAKGISLGAKTLEIKPLVLESIETKEWSKGTLLSPSFYQESLERLSLAPSFIESKDLSINALSTTIKASNIKARDVSINTQALDLMSLKNRETKSSFSSNASSFLLAKNTKEGSIKEVAIPSTLSFSNSFVFNGRDLSKEVQEISKGLNNESQESLTLSSEMPLALDSSMVFSKAILENKQWSERSKSLTPLSHLLLQAALAYISAGINLPIHSTFVSSVAKGSMQGALGSGVFQVSNKLIDSKNALSFRSFTKDTLGGGLKAGIGLLPLNLSLVEGIETLPLREIVLNASVDTLVYKESFKESLLEYSLLALGNSLYKGVGDIAQIQSMKGNNLFKEGGLGKVVLHSGVGGVMASLKNENFFKGALISGIHESIAPLRGNPIENKEREVLISKVYGGVVGGLLGGNSLMALGSALSESALRNNAMMHYGDRIMIVDTINNGVGIELTQEGLEKIEEYAKMGLYGITKDNAYGKDVYVFKGSMMEELKDFIKDTRYVKETLDLNKEVEKERFIAKTDLNFIDLKYLKKDVNFIDSKYLNKDSKNVGFNNNSQPKLVVATGISTDEARAREIGLFTQQLFQQDIKVIHNKTHSFLGVKGARDIIEYKSKKFSTGDFATAHEMQQLPEDSVYMGHSGGSGDALDGMVVNAIQGGNSPIHVVAIGSPERKEDFIKVGKEVGVKSVSMFNNPLDPVANPTGIALDIVGNAIVGASRGGAIGENIGKTMGGTMGGTMGKIIGTTMGGINGAVLGAKDVIGNIRFRLEKYHSFESHFENPEFQLQQTIQRLLMQDAMKGINEKGLGDD